MTAGVELDKRMDGVDATDAEGARGARLRSMAGKALVVFLALMAALTWSGKMLEEMTIAVVSAAAPQRGSLDKQISASGKLAAAVTLPILVEDSARVMDVSVTAGALVKAGDPLFTMDYTKLMESAKDSVDQAQRTVDWAIADMTALTYNRLIGQIDALSALEQTLTDAQADGDAETVRKAQAAYDMEKQRLYQDQAARNFASQLETLAKAQDELSRLNGLTDANGMRTVLAPADGSVTAVSVSVGAMTQSSGAAMMLADQSGGLSLTVQVSEDSAGELAAGDTARVTVGAADYNIPIRSITLSPNSADIYDVSFLLPGDAGTVGQSASMRVQKRTANYDVIIPLNALHSDSDGDFVYVIEQSQSSLGARVTVRRADVFVIDQDSGRAALQTGTISQRDTIAARSDRSIADGDRVRVE